MLAIATESIIKLVAFLAVGIFVTFVMFPGPVTLFTAALATPADGRGADAGTAGDRVSRHDGAVAVCDPAVAAAVPRRRRREPQRGRNPPRRLAVPGLSRAHQSVRDADRDGRPADVSSRRHRRRHVRAGAAAQGAFRTVRAGRLCRRPVGGDRHGDRRIGRARDHGVERHRDTAHSEAAGGALRRAERRRRAAPDGAPHRHLRHPVSRLHLLSLRRRGAARLDRAPVIRRHRAVDAGLLRWTGLAARHRARRHRRHERRHSGLGLYASAAEHLRCRHRRRAHPHRRAVRRRLAAAAGAVRSRSGAARPRRRSQPSSPILRSISAALSAAGRPRSSACRRMCLCRRRWRRWRRASGCGALRSPSRN